MYIILKHSHSLLAILTLLNLVIAIGFGLYSLIVKKPFSKNHKLFYLQGMVFSHLQILLGIILYFVSPLGLSNFSGESMKLSFTRLFIVEHPLMMIIAGVLITIGYIRSKKAIDDNKKHKAIVIFYSIGLLFIASRIPWAYWLN